MSNKSSPRRRSVANKRYDEDYEYYVPVRQYNKAAKSEATADDAESSEAGEPKKRKGRPPGPKAKTPEQEVKRGPGRPRRYVAAQEDAEENKPMEVDIVRVEPEVKPTEESPAKKEKVELGQVLELAVQSMSVTMEEEGEESAPKATAKKSAPPPEPVKSEAAAIKTVSSKEAEASQHILTSCDSPEDGRSSSSDFEWKLENEDDGAPGGNGSAHSPPAKKKKMSAGSSGNAILPPNADDLEEFEEDGEGRIQVRTIVVGEGEGARIECLSCHRIMKPGSLKAHLKTHAHERPHACDLCEARFTRRGDLERHIKVVHNKDRPFKCSKCHRTFGDKKNLRWHLTNHDRKLFHHCQVCGFKFGKREYWENHVRYIHPIPGNDLEPIPAETQEVEPASSSEAGTTSAAASSGSTTVVINIPKSKVSDPAVISKVSKMLNGNKGSSPMIYTKRGGAGGQQQRGGSLSGDPFAGLKMPKVVFPPTYWDKWDEFMERTLVLRFRPSIQRYGSSGRPLRRKKVPETEVELKPVERPDSQFDLNAVASMTEEDTMLDEQTGAFINVKGEVVSYPEDLRKLDDQAEEEEEEEEEEPEPEPVRIDVGDLQLDQPLSGGEVLSTHHLVYGEDGQMRLMVGPGRVDGHHELVEGGTAYEDVDEDGMLRADLSQAFVESGQIVILQPDGSAVLAPAGGQLVETENGQLILVQTHEDGTQTAVAYATAQVDDLEGAVSVAAGGEFATLEGVEEDEAAGRTEESGASNQDAVQTLIDAVQELIDNRQKPS